MDKKTFKIFIKFEVDKIDKTINLNFIKRLYSMLSNRYLIPSTNAVYLVRKMQYLHSKKNFINKIRVAAIHRKLVYKYGIMISPNAKIDLGLRFPHPTSIVIGNSVIAGKNLTIYQNTTIGGSRTGDVKLGNQPKIGDNVTFFGGSMVLGAITVQNNVTVGANSVLLKDAEENGTYVGTPASIVKKI